MLLEISGEITPEKNEETTPKKKQHPVVDGTGDRSKIQCYKEQYCIGTWNVKSMNQGKLEVVKQEIAVLASEECCLHNTLKYRGRVWHKLFQK